MARLLEGAKIPYMIVGAHAVFVHGIPRFSVDLDVALHVPVDARDGIRTHLQSWKFTAIEWKTDPEWGERYFALDPTGLPVEFFFSARSAVQDREFERRVKRRIDDTTVWLISPEDLVLRKLVNVRLRHKSDFEDAVGVLRIQGQAFDSKYVQEHCATYRVCALFERAVEAAKSP